MKETLCPKCNNTISYADLDYVFICDYCSTSFTIEADTAEKVRLTDHYMLPNKINGDRAKEIFLDFLAKNFHKAILVNKEFFIKQISGRSFPFWVTSIEASSHWMGYSEKVAIAPGLEKTNDAIYAMENDSFSRKYRWAIFARKNIKSFWGLTKLHHPADPILVDWNGFTFDESLGKQEDGGKANYDMREYFNVNFCKEIPILPAQIDENSAVMRSKEQINTFHRRISKTMVGSLSEYRTDFEVAGIQLVHIPLWHISYTFKPSGLLKFFYKPSEKWALINGCNSSIIKVEFPIEREDKVFVNLFLTLFFSIIFVVLGAKVSPLFYMITVFLLGIIAASIYSTFGKKTTDPELLTDKEAVGGSL